MKMSIPNLKSLRFFSDELKHKELLRDYVQSALYDSQRGYFTNPKNIQLGHLKSAIRFSSLLGYSDYIEQLSANYPKHKFLTPSEIFRPYYGMTMASYVYKQQKKHNIDKIKVVEIGSGIGGQADSFLMYFKNFEPDVYPYIEYTLLEISPTLLHKSKSTLYQNHKEKCQRGEIKFVNQDAFKFKEDIGSDVFFMLFEILDNLPHDIVRFTSKLDKIEEMWIKSSLDRQTRQIAYEPCKDEYIVRCFELWKSLYVKNEKLLLNENESEKQKFLASLKDWLQSRMANDYQLSLPTGFYKLTEHINNNFENPKFLLSDFSSLPNARRYLNGSKCLNYPLLSTKLEKSEDHKDYEDFEKAEFGRCDIFFETDFDLTKAILESFSEKYTVSTPKEFFKQFAKPKWAETRSGYNPMKDDFLNTRFLHQ